MSTWRTLARWTEADAVAALAALKQSGLSVALFAAREGLDAQRLYVWRRKLARHSDFIELTPTTPVDVGATLRGFEVEAEVARSRIRLGHAETIRWQGRRVLSRSA